MLSNQHFIVDFLFSRIVVLNAILNPFLLQIAGYSVKVFAICEQLFQEYLFFLLVPVDLVLVCLEQRDRILNVAVRVYEFVASLLI